MTRPRRRAILPPGVSRTDEPRWRKHGYTVRMGWSPKHRGQPKLKRFFGDYTHGSKREALRAASLFVLQHTPFGGRKAAKGVRR